MNINWLLERVKGVRQRILVPAGTEIPVPAGAGTLLILRFRLRQKWPGSTGSGSATVETYVPSIVPKLISRRS